MSTSVHADATTEAIAVVEHFASCIEDAFAQIGDFLGRGHSIFQDLNGGLTQLSDQLSGAEIEGASVALQTIAARLRGLAEALPSESALLSAIGASATKASTLLNPLVKQIAMIMIIARSARIEAASLDENQGSFLDFTEEAFGLARSVQTAVEACANDHKQLLGAVELALKEQRDFEKRYHQQLYSVGSDLIAAHSEMRDRQDRSVKLAGLTNESTRNIAEAVGHSIVSLQAGDSARQRLEHACRGLRIAADSETSIVPAPDTTDGTAPDAPFICILQAAQLRETIAEFGGDTGIIERSLAALSSDTNAMVDRGHQLFGGRGADKDSFLVLTKERLSRASALIMTCEDARKSVDGTLSVVEETLGKFRGAIEALSETVVDIILIGMNAGLKASHLGSQGRAFVVIANELKITADNISAGAGSLKPVLDHVGQSADELKRLRAQGDSSQMADLELAIVEELREIEAGDNQLSRLVSRVVDEGAQFEILMKNAQATLAALTKKQAVLPDMAGRLERAAARAGSVPPSAMARVETVFDDLYAQYTMDGERNVHRKVVQRLGLIVREPEPKAEAADTDDVLFF